MALEIKIGLDAITSYRRLAYTPWHAIAEFVDNSTQACFDNKDILDAVLQQEGTPLWVSIAYEPNTGFLRISDNSIGMSYEELERALHVALPPRNTTGRCKYGMGLKTAACWLGNKWTIRTKKLGETTEHSVTVDVEVIANGSGEIPYTAHEDKRPEDHYTVIEITEHNRRFQGRTIGKIKDFLRSMYREDFRRGLLKLVWQGSELVWEEQALLKSRSGSPYRKDFEFDVDGRRIHGWVGILERGSRAEAGFSIIHCGRVVRGWPDSWRPSSLYGQLQGSNDLVNQRLVGEIHLDEFDVSHTKDDILWLGDQEDLVEEKLREYCGDYREIAKRSRKAQDEERGPSEMETNVAVDELKKELESPEMVDAVTIDIVPPEDVVDETFRKLVGDISRRQATFSAMLKDLTVKGYLAADLSPNDPYVVVEMDADEVIVVINTAHPHWSQLKGSEGVLNYLRHCTYDGIAEWQASRKAGRIDPATVKILKDKLLRIPFVIEMNAAEESADITEAPAEDVLL